MEPWVGVVLMMAIPMASGVLVGVIVGWFVGHGQGYEKASNYHNGYRHEDSEIIKRLREESMKIIDRNCLLESNIAHVIEQLQRTREAENEP